MLIAVGIDAVGHGQRLDVGRRRLAAEGRRQPGAQHIAVHNGGDLEAAELEAVDGRLNFTLH